MIPSMKTTIYAVAQAFEKQPIVAKECVEDGHEIASVRLASQAEERC